MSTRDPSAATGIDDAGTNRPPPAGGPAAEYTRRLEARRSAYAAVDGLHRRLGAIRLGVFAALLVMAYAALARGWLAAAWLIAPIAALLWLGHRMRRCERERARAARAVTLYEHGLRRLDGQWAGTGAGGDRFADPHHLYSRDLDLFGEGSMFELLCAARTGIGQATLAGWLLSPASPETVAQRQQAVDELAKELDLREDLAVIGEDARDEIHPETLISWGEHAPSLRERSLRFGIRALALVGVLGFFAVFTWLGALLRLYPLPESTFAWLPAFALTVAVVNGLIGWRHANRTRGVLHDAESAAPELDLLAALLGRIERQRFRSVRLIQLRAQLDTEGRPSSRRIAQLDALMSLVDSRHNNIVRLLGVFVFWDLNLAFALEDWRAASGHGIRRWLETIGETETLASLARYRYERPDDTFPEVAPGRARLEGENLGHPLLPPDRLVRNDVHLGATPAVLVVSGSNMSGKSTLLRTIGINVVLAQAGAPVRARRMSMSPLAIGASIRIVDSLREGTSRFYAEITRLRAIVGRAESTLPVLFLIDEMLHGTNSHDRRIGAEAIVRGLLERAAIGLVTTHDLALTEIAAALGPPAANVHFADEMVAGKLHFDFRLRDGVVRKSNAIELMRSIGLDV